MLNIILKWYLKVLHLNKSLVLLIFSIELCPAASAPRESMSTFSEWSKWCGSCRTWCGTCRKGITKMCAKGQGAQLHRIMWTSYGSLAAQSWLLLLGQTVHRCSSLRECFGSCEYNLIPDNCYEWNLLFQNNILQQPSNMVVTFWWLKVAN